MAMQCLLLSVNSLMIIINLFFCVAGEGGDSEIY